jgi:hypothetical protein
VISAAVIAVNRRRENSRYEVSFALRDFLCSALSEHSPRR